MQYEKNNRIVIFGANSMVGSYLIAHLFTQGYSNIVCVVRNVKNITLLNQIGNSYGIDSISEKVEFIEGECSNYLFVKSILQENDIVYNTAAAVSLKNSDNSIIEQNISIAHSIAQVSIEKKVRLIVHTSSVSTIGKDENDARREDLVPNSIIEKNYYSQSKFYSEGEFWRAIHYGLDVVIINPSVILGIGNYNGNSSAALIKKFSRGSLFGTHGTTGWVSARDVATAMEKLSHCQKAYGNRYIINGEDLEYGNVINCISSQFGKKPIKFYFGKKTISLACYVINVISKLRIVKGLSTQTIRGLYSNSTFDNTKIKETIDIKFTPVNAIIKECCEHYKTVKNEI